MGDGPGPSETCDVGAVCKTLLDALDVAVLVFDGSGRVVFYNAATQRILAEGAGIHIIAGRLGGLPEERHALVAAVRECLAAIDGGHHGPPRCVRVSRAMRPPLILSLTGIRLAEPDRFGPLAVGVILDPEVRTSLQPAEIAPRYGLSPTEARIASLTCDGKVAKDIARELDIGVATVRAHLKSIYAKVGVHTGIELIAMMRGSVFHRHASDDQYP